MKLKQFYRKSGFTRFAIFSFLAVCCIYATQKLGDSTTHKSASINNPTEVIQQQDQANEFTQKYAGIEYKEMFHSNDIINLNLVDHIFIEDGEISIEEIDKYRLKF